MINKYEFIGLIEQELELLEGLSWKQELFKAYIHDALEAKLPEQVVAVASQKFWNICNFIQQALNYLQLDNEEDGDEYEEKAKELAIKVNDMLIRPAELSTATPSNSFLAALYYVNDIIAGSSAMGRGTEESIIPNESHCRALSALLFELAQSYSGEEKTLGMIRRWHWNTPDSGLKLAALMIDIAEQNYARLVGWKDGASFRHGKLRRIDEFYQEKAECCMAKGAMYLLRALGDLQTKDKEVLCQLSLSQPVIEGLARSSQDSLAEIKSEVDFGRRYRGGNSARAWLDLRNKVAFTPVSSSPQVEAAMVDRPSTPPNDGIEHKKEFITPIRNLKFVQQASQQHATHQGINVTPIKVTRKEREEEEKRRASSEMMAAMERYALLCGNGEGDLDEDGKMEVCQADHRSYNSQHN